MNINDLSLTPFFYSSSSEEENLLPIESTEETAEEITPPKEENQRAKTDLSIISQAIHLSTALLQLIPDPSIRLTLAQAEDLIFNSINGRIIHYLCPLNLLFVDIMKTLRQLKKDPSIYSSSGNAYYSTPKGFEAEEVKGYKVCQLLSVQINLLFRHFRKHSFLFEGEITSRSERKNLIYARINYVETDKLFIQLESLVNALGSYETKKLCRMLKQYCDILYHLCHTESFLIKSSKSLSGNMDIETSVLTYPPGRVHFDFYLDSLDLSLSSLVDYRQMKKDEASILAQHLEEIKELSKCSLDGLEKFTLSVQIHKNNIDQLGNAYFKASDNILLQSKLNKANLSLQAYFQGIESRSLSLVKTLQEMTPLVQQVCCPWTLFRDECHAMLEKYDKECDLLEPQIKQTFQSFENLLKANKKLSRETKNQIKDLLNSIKVLLSEETFKIRFNALLVETIRLTMNTAQEILIFFCKKIKPLNLEADAFHQSLVRSQKELPCAAFSAIDLFIQQVFQFTELLEKEASCKVITASIRLKVRKTVKQLMLMEFDSLLKAEERDKTKILQDFFLNLINTTQSIHHHLEGPHKDHPLKKSTRLLLKYLENLGEIEIFNLHITSGLTDPIGPQTDISLADIPLIREQMRMITLAFAEQNIEEHLNALEKALREKFESAIESGKFFWKANLKNAILSRLAINERQREIKRCYQELESSETVNQVLEALHRLHSRRKSTIEKRCKGWNIQLTLLGRIAQNEGCEPIYSPIRAISSWDVSTEFFLKPTNEIVLTNPRPRRTSPFQISSTPTRVETWDERQTDSDSGEEEKFQENENLLSLSNLSQETFLPSPYESNLSLIAALQKEKLPLLNANEQIESFSARAIGRDELLKNSCIYLTLIEEAKKWSSLEFPKSLQMRGQIDFMLLLEAAQKIALASLRIATKEAPSIHILASKDQGGSLLYTHNGMFLTSLLRSSGKKWFEQTGIQSSIQYQELLLKRVYWFQEEQQEVEKIALITACCETAWKELGSSAKHFKPTDIEKDLYAKTANFKECRLKIHKYKRNQAPLSLPILSLPEIRELQNEIIHKIALLQFDPHCCDLAKGFIGTVGRILGSGCTLMAYNGKNSTPLNFAVRSAEIQVSLLSSVLILALSTLKENLDQQHPLFSDQGGRALFQSHRVDRLWKVLKSYLAAKTPSDRIALLDNSLPHFVGDPRYPYPNKTVMTNEIVSMHEKVYLLKKIEDGSWFSNEDQPLLAKYLGKEGKLKSSGIQKEILNRSIMQAVDVQQRKTWLAFELAAVILRACV